MSHIQTKHAGGSPTTPPPPPPLYTPTSTSLFSVHQHPPQLTFQPTYICSYGDRKHKLRLKHTPQRGDEGISPTTEDALRPARFQLLRHSSFPRLHFRPHAEMAAAFPGATSPLRLRPDRRRTAAWVVEEPAAALTLRSGSFMSPRGGSCS